MIPYITKPKRRTESIWKIWTKTTKFATITNQFSIYLKGLLFEKKISRILSDAAILQDVDFLFEVKKRIYARILPYQHEPDTLEFVLNQVFFKSSDPIWISRIPFAVLFTGIPIRAMMRCTIQAAATAACFPVIPARGIRHCTIPEQGIVRCLSAENFQDTTPIIL